MAKTPQLVKQSSQAHEDEKLFVLCRICGTKMEEVFCSSHKEKTGHGEFRPCFEEENE